MKRVAPLVLALVMGASPLSRETVGAELATPAAAAAPAVASGQPPASVVASVSTLASVAPPSALASASATPRAAMAASESAECSPAGDMHFVCGVSGVEDMLPVGGGRWLVGGSLRQLHADPPKAGSAGLYLIDTTAKTARSVALSIAPKLDSLYADCRPPDLKRLNTHGIDVSSSDDPSTTVYAINHEGRESVEVFRLQPAAATAQWVGCVVLPPAAIGNAVAALPNGALVVSKFLDADDKDSAEHARAGKITGVIYLWTPGKGFTVLPGTLMSGANGLLISRDHKWLYIAAWGSKQIYRVPLSGTGESSVITVDFSPDNLRWAPDGKIFVTGQFLTPENRGGWDPWTTVRLDPQTMAISPVLKEPANAHFGDGTTTVQIGQTLWIGSFRGDRVAYLAAP